jgi:hypothetical protein
MKNNVSMMMFADFSEGGAGGQDANLKRSVLFTIRENEEFGSADYFLYNYLFVLQRMNQNHFACVIRNEFKDSNTFVFNGNRIAPGNSIGGFGRPFDFHYLDVREEYGYIFEYRLQGMNYINIKGKVYGPFDTWNYGSTLVFAEDGYGNLDYSKFYYCKTEGGSRNYYLHYNGVKKGPFEGIFFSQADDADFEYFYLLADKWYAYYSNGSSKITSIVYGYIYEKDGKEYVNINGEDSKGYDKIRELHFTQSGNYAYIYTENGKEHVNVNGKESREYDNVAFFSLHLYENGNYAYMYKDKDKKWYVNINGEDKKDIGYYEFDSFKFVESGQYVCRYMENEKQYININGEVSRGYDEISRICFNESGKYAYIYNENKKWYVNINGKESRKYDRVYKDSLHLTESGNCAYSHEKNGKKYININGEDSEEYDEMSYFSFTESGKYMYWYKEDGKCYVCINGEISRGYDAVKEFSLCICENGKYAYAYEENGKCHVNINGEESRGYDDVSLLCLIPSGQYAYKYVENEKEYANINGEDGKGYDDIICLWMTEDGDFCFYYHNDDGETGKNENGKEFETKILAMGENYDATAKLFRNRDYGSALEIHSIDRKHSFYYTDGAEYMEIDGKGYDNVSLPYAWYDKEKHAFSWNVIEDKELVLYEYKL